MKKFAVAMNNFDGDLKLEIIEADTLKEAIKKHLFSNFAKKDDPSQVDYWKWIDDQPDDLEEIQEAFIQCDQNIDVVEL
jgi:hypothetical protein